jgi:hypothetical protein
LRKHIKREREIIVMEITHPRIVGFFKEHMDLNPEETILKFIDIMESLHENMNKTMNNSVVSEILDSIKSMQGKLDTVSNDVNKITGDTQTQFALKMTEFKQDYIRELEKVLTCNVANKIEPLFKEQNSALFDRTESMLGKLIPKNDAAVAESIKGIIREFQDAVSSDTRTALSQTIDRESFSAYVVGFDKKLADTISASQSILTQAIGTTEQRLESKMENIKELSTASNTATSSLHVSVNGILQKFENSSAKGQLSENLILNVLEQAFPSAEITAVGKTKETGDIMVERMHKPKVLVENKIWNRSVVQAEVVKFIRDIEVQNCCGIFLSQNGKITTKENFEINIHNGNVLVYVHDVHNDADKIKLAFDIVDHLKDKLDEFSEEGAGGEESISKEMLEYINAEFQNFTAAKMALTKLAKDFNKKFLKQVEEIKMPTLEDYLSTKYAFSSNKFVCEYCSFVGKNQQSKSAHLRGCFAKKKHEKGQAPNIVITSELGMG